MPSPPLRSVRDIGALIREQRSKRGMSQQDLADSIGVSRVWVSQVESGKAGAELGLVLRALTALGMTLKADVGLTDAAGAYIDIDAIVENARRRR